MARKNLLILLLWGAAIVALGAFLWVRVLEPRMTQTVGDTLGQGEYTLTTTEGDTFTQDSLAGAPSAVFFGFTHCPDVCPTTLGDILTWQEELGEEGSPLRVFFITVDPERDSVDALRDYVSWVPGVQGVSGPREEIDKAIRAFRIYASKMPLEDGGYTMDHSASVLLFDEDGRFYEPVGYQEDPDRVLSKLRHLTQG